MIGLGSTITPGSSGWEYILSPMRMRDPVIAATGDVVVELAPEGPQRGDLASDIAAALEATRPLQRSSIPWRSSTGRPTSAGSIRPRAGQTCVPRASLR